MNHKVNKFHNNFNNILDSNLRKISLIIYLRLKHYYKDKKGRSFSVNLVKQVVLTLFKLRYGLPDRALERLFNIDHVTISRIIARITRFIVDNNFIININPNNKLEYYVVDSTTVRIGKTKNKKSDIPDISITMGLSYRLL